jgi:hypothetical protein
MSGAMAATILPQILPALVLYWAPELEILEFHLGIVDRIGALLLYQLKAEEVLLAILLAAWVMGVVTTIMV